MKRVLLRLFLAVLLGLTIAASLPDADRQEVYADLMSSMSVDHANTGVIPKGDLRTAVNNTDQFISDNATAYNAVLPLSVRTTLSNKEKARLFLFVAKRRFDIE